MAVKETDNFIGGRGKEIRFRPERKRVSAILEDLDLDCLVHFDGGGGKLVDFSINGVSFLTREPPETGARLDGFLVTIGEAAVYRGSASVRHVKEEGDGWKVGVNLLDDVLDIDRIMEIRNFAQMNTGIKEVSHLLGHQEVDADYRATIGDMVYLLTSYRKLLGKQEEQLEPMGPVERAEMEEAILKVAEPAFLEEFVRLRKELNRIIAPHGLTTPEPYRQFTIRTIMEPFFLGAPFHARAFLKPLGYAGDYVTMTYLYEERRRGETLFDKIVHQTSKAEPIGRAVKYRKLYMVEKLATRVSTADDSEVEILSIACGPATEIEEFAAAYAGHKRVHFTLMDQDDRALAYASRRLSKVFAPSGKPLDATYLYVAVRQLLKDPEVLGSIPPQDMIYTAGLFDYLSQRFATGLCERLYSILKPGGLLVVGNMKAPTDSRWMGSYLLDWDLLYRTEEQLLDLVAGLPGAMPRIEYEQTGYNAFLVVEKT